MNGWIIGTLLMLLAVPAQADEIDDQLDDVTIMCSAILAVIAVKLDEPETTLRESEWFAQWTTTDLIESERVNIQVALNMDWERVWPILLESAALCSNMRREVENG